MNVLERENIVRIVLLVRCLVDGRFCLIAFARRARQIIKASDQPKRTNFAICKVAERTRLGFGNKPGNSKGGACMWRPAHFITCVTSEWGYGVTGDVLRKCSHRQQFSLTQWQHCKSLRLATALLRPCWRLWPACGPNEPVWPTRIFLTPNICRLSCWLCP